MTETERIINGLQDACLTSFLLKDGDYTKIRPEYLLTTLVAQQFAFEDSGLIVKLEEPTGEFATSCVKQKNSSFQLSEKHNVFRKGSIDIAVYFSKNQEGYFSRNKSNFPIELKGINPNNKGYLEDIKRNLSFFDIEDTNTGKSVINRTFNASIEEAKKFHYSEDVDKFRKAVENKYRGWLAPYAQSLADNNLELKITVEPIMSDLHSINDTYDLSEGGTEWDYLQSWHLYVGVVVEISRKNDSKSNVLGKENDL